MIALQLGVLAFDKFCTDREMVPKWFLRNRLIFFGVYLGASLCLYAVYFFKNDSMQYKNDPLRIPKVMSVEDLVQNDTDKMKNEWSEAFKDTDFREVEE